MKPSYFLLATAAVLASAACNAQKGHDTPAAGASNVLTPVKPPANGDWSTVFSDTSAGGILMGNPNAKVKLVELGSLTCPHCRAFEEEGAEPLINNYVKSGKVSYEFRNYVRDPFDIAAALIARCNGAKSFFPLIRAIYDAQPQWIAKIQAAPQGQLEALQNLPPDKQFLEIAKLADLQKLGAMRGVPSAKSTHCLTNQAKVDQLVQMNSDATTDFPEMPGTPTFVINGKMLDKAATWDLLEPQIRKALGS